jgi:hypothetical protein
LELLIDPFIAIDEIYAESPELAESALEALLGLGSALSGKRRQELSAVMAKVADGSAFDLLAKAAEADPKLLPPSVGEKAVALLGEVDVDTPAFRAFRGWLKSNSPAHAPQNGFADLVTQRISTKIAPGVSDVEAERRWLLTVGATLGELTHLDTTNADALRSAAADALQRGGVTPLASELLDIFETAAAWGTRDASDQQADDILRWFDSVSRSAFLDYVESRAKRWKRSEGFGWRIQHRLREIMRQGENSEEEVLRAAHLNSLIDPDDHEEIIGGSVPALVTGGHFAMAAKLRAKHPRAAALYAPNTVANALEVANTQLPRISEDALNFLFDIRDDLDEAGRARLQQLLRNQVDTGDTDSQDAAFQAADRFAEASRDFRDVRNGLLAELFDRIAGADLPPRTASRLTSQQKRFA